MAVLSSALADDSPGPAHTKSPPATNRLASVGNAVDLQGNLVDPFEEPGKVTVLVFVSVECPISNRYSPEIQRLANRFEPKGARFWLIYPDADTLGTTIEKHLKDYRYSIRALRDPHHSLVRRAGARVTPEAAVFAADGRLLYHGRIDDRFVDFGKERIAPTQHDLHDAVEAVLAQKPVARETTRAVGCYISQ